MTRKHLELVDKAEIFKLYQEEAAKKKVTKLDEF